MISYLSSAAGSAMKGKSPLLISVFFFILFIGLSGFGLNSVGRRLKVSHMEARFGAAESALRQGQMQVAGRGYRGGLEAWHQALELGCYYPDISGEYLLAGNCYQQQRQPRAAIKCYEEGLPCDPVSISLLTTLGGCAFRLGDYEKAFAALQKSRSIYPLKKEVRPLWKKLRLETRGEKR